MLSALTIIVISDSRRWVAYLKTGYNRLNTFTLDLFINPQFQSYFTTFILKTNLVFSNPNIYVVFLTISYTTTSTEVMFILILSSWCINVMHQRTLKILCGLWQTDHLIWLGKVEFNSTCEQYVLINRNVIQTINFKCNHIFRYK